MTERKRLTPTEQLYWTAVLDLERAIAELAFCQKRFDEIEKQYNRGAK